MSLARLLEQNRLGLTVYMPDSAESRLHGNLDAFISRETGLRPVFRRWFRHSAETVSAFYSAASESGTTPTTEEVTRRYRESVPTSLTSPQLFMYLQITGPSLLTLWEGDDPTEALLAKKGATHPADAQAGTIRGGFWCDNPVCNLVHSSDDAGEVERELRSVNILHALRESPRTFDPIRTQAETQVRHSSIWVACQVVDRMLAEVACPQRSEAQLPATGYADEAEQACRAALERIATDGENEEAAEFAESFLRGNTRALELLDRLPATAWETFVLRAGVLSRDRWNEHTPQSSGS